MLLSISEKILKLQKREFKYEPFNLQNTSTNIFGTPMGGRFIYKFNI